MIRTQHITTTGRAARAMRGACALGVLALVAVALSACASPEEVAAQKAAAAQNERTAQARMERSFELAEELCFPIMDGGDLDAFLSAMEARAAAEDLPAPIRYETQGLVAGHPTWRISWELASASGPKEIGLFVWGDRRDSRPFRCEIRFLVDRPLWADLALTRRGDAMAAKLFDRHVARLGGTPDESANAFRAFGNPASPRSHDAKGVTYTIAGPWLHDVNYTDGVSFITNPASGQGSVSVTAD